MTISANKRIRGEFDAVDLIAGILIALCIPTLTYFVLKNTGAAQKSDPQGYQKKDGKTGLAKPDSELVAIQLEERDLVAEFGDEYRAYRARTPMLLPRPRRAAAAEQPIPGISAFRARKCQNTAAEASRRCSTATHCASAPNRRKMDCRASSRCLC